MSLQSSLLRNEEETGSMQSGNYRTISVPQDGAQQDRSSGPKRDSAIHGAYALPDLAKRGFLSIIHTIYDQWFLVALLLLILIASQKQVPQKDQQLKKTLVIYICVSVIFFITGCTLPTNVLLQTYSRWKLHLFCQSQSFVLISAMVFGIVSAAASNSAFMDPGLLIGLLLTGCVPTTISSNVVLTQQAGGNQALTVGTCLKFGKSSIIALHKS